MTTLLPRPRGTAKVVKRGKPVSPISPADTGAAEESRTLDLNLGKVALYQLSYCREEVQIIADACTGNETIIRGSYWVPPGVFQAARRYTTIDQSVMTAATPMSTWPTGRVSKMPKSRSS